MHFNFFRDKQGESRIYGWTNDRRLFIRFFGLMLRFEAGRVHGLRWLHWSWGGGYTEGVQFSAGLGYGVWVTLELPWGLTRRIPGWPQHQERELGLSQSDGKMRLLLGHEPMGTYYGGRGLSKMFKNLELKLFDMDWIVGRDKHRRENATELRRILVPVGEWLGDEYPYDVHLETVSWSNRFRTKRRTYWEFKAVDGLAYNQRAGKGENSWDCDDDGIYGCSFEFAGQELPALIEQMKQRILADRRRYGRPSSAPHDLAPVQG